MYLCIKGIFNRIIGFLYYMQLYIISMIDFKILDPRKNRDKEFDPKIIKSEPVIKNINKIHTCVCRYKNDFNPYS